MRVTPLILIVLLVQTAGLMFGNEVAAAELRLASLKVDIVFTTEEIRIIRAHYESHGGKNQKGQGKNKQKGLPPGIAKNLQRGKPLPPGIAKRSLPHDLGLALPQVPDGYERIVVAGKILLIEIASQIVVDVLSDALFK